VRGGGRKEETLEAQLFMDYRIDRSAFTRSFYSQALQELLPGREKVEKAMLLGQAVDYIQQLQVPLPPARSNHESSAIWIYPHRKLLNLDYRVHF
jgi:hypothetical protein